MWQIPYQSSCWHRRKHKHKHNSTIALRSTQPTSCQPIRSTFLLSLNSAEKAKNDITKAISNINHTITVITAASRQFHFSVCKLQTQKISRFEKLLNFQNCILLWRDKRKSISIYISIPDIGSLSKLISIVWRRQIFALGNNERRKKCQFEQTSTIEV